MNEQNNPSAQFGAEKEDNNENIYLYLVLGLLAVFLFNQYSVYSISNAIQADLLTGAAAATVSTSATTATPVSYGDIDVIPKGVPAVYGSELGVSYNDVSPNDPYKADATIGVLGNLDNKITLSGADLTRYIKIASQISCEYCCGAKSIIFSNGQAACGCAHSYAMRGLAKYLITKHGKEFTDDQVLEELGKWKTLFFPSQITQKASILKAQGIELNYINLASNKYRMQ